MTPSENFCSCCREKRKEEGLGPLALTRLPIGIAQKMEKPGLPIRVCVHCDGDAYKMAMRTTKK